MSARVLSARSPSARVSGFMSSATALAISLVACGGEDDGGDLFSKSGGSGGIAGSAGASASGGSSAGSSSGGDGGGSARGGSSATSGATGGGSGKGGGGQGVAGGAGTGGGAGGDTTSGDAGEGASGTSSGKAGRPAADGGSAGSPYERECHGDTVECGDPETLLCLGIRVGDEVFGYSCSNECETNADCSPAAGFAESAAECVDFVTTSYCLLVCQNGDTTTSCPDGMYCYVYPGSPIGYCLWQ